MRRAKMSDVSCSLGEVAHDNYGTSRAGPQDTIKGDTWRSATEPSKPVVTRSSAAGPWVVSVTSAGQ